MYHGPPTWIYFISPFVSMVAVIVAYLLGNMQGQAQTRYDRATEALTQILALAIEAEDYLLTLRSFQGFDDPVAEWSGYVVSTESRLRDVYRSSRPWLSTEQRRHVDAVVGSFGPVVTLLMLPKAGAPVDATSLAEVLEGLDVETPLDALDEEVTRLASAPTVLQRLWNSFLAYRAGS